MENEHLEGRHALAEALDAHVPVQVIYANDAAFRDKRASKLLARAQADGIRIERATSKSSTLIHHMELIRASLRRSSHTSMRASSSSSIWRGMPLTHSSLPVTT